MKRPILVLDGRSFQSGISAMGAHAERVGILYKAAGVTPLFGAGSSEDQNNGLLMAGASGTAVSNGSVTGSIIRLVATDSGGGFYGATDDNELISLGSSGGVPNDTLVLDRTISGQVLTPGLVVFNNFLFYRQVAQIGQVSYGPTTYDDDWGNTVTADYFGAMHVHYALNKVIFGNGLGKVGTISSACTTTPNSGVTVNALTIDAYSMATAISDDGIYVILAITRNTLANTNGYSETRILFWDGSTTTGFVREYVITDPVIYALQKTPIGVFAFGVTGIWQVSFDGVVKVLSHAPGVYVKNGVSIHYGHGATSFFSDALLWGGNVGSGTTRALKTLGKLDSAALTAYLNPILLTANTNVTAVSGQILKGYIFAADETPQLKYYPIGSGTPQTGVTAQTVYFSLPQPYDITHINVVFGEPLASGDTLDVDVYRDQDNSAVDFGAVSYTANKSIRRHQFRPQKGANTLNVYDQLSLLITFTAGAVKIKRIEVYGDPVVATV